MQFEIVCQHDDYTIEAADRLTALAAVALLGEGVYGVRGHGLNAPPIPMTDDWEPAIYQTCGVQGGNAVFGRDGKMNTDSAFNEATAKALDSITRKTRLSNLVDLVQQGRDTAKALRGKARFSDIE